MEAKLKHLEMIQGIINRMGQNSFLLKSWGVVIVSALFALSTTDSNSILIVIAYIPAISFWILDGYFLKQEKLFRELYDMVRIKATSDIDFSIDVSTISGKVDTWFRVLFTKTLGIFYGTVLLVISIAVIFLYLTCHKGVCDG